MTSSTNTALAHTHTFIFAWVSGEHIHSAGELLQLLQQLVLQLLCAGALHIEVILVSRAALGRTRLKMGHVDAQFLHKI